MPVPLSLTSPARLPLIAPSILSADFARMGDECRHVLEAGADLLHLDVMDGHFVPNLTMGPDLCRALRRALPSAFLDVHLMVRNPAMFVEPFAAAGANNVTFHIEVMPPDEAVSLARTVRARGLTAGLAINPPTAPGPFIGVIGEFDLALVMSVNPGFSGQKFIDAVLEKTRVVRARLRADQRLQMDGGINIENATAVRQAGCDVLVAASAIFGLPAKERPRTIDALRG